MLDPNVREFLTWDNNDFLVQASFKESQPAMDPFGKFWH